MKKLVSSVVNGSPTKSSVVFGAEQVTAGGVVDEVGDHIGFPYCGVNKEIAKHFKTSGAKLTESMKTLKNALAKMKTKTTYPSPFNSFLR